MPERKRDESTGQYTEKVTTEAVLDVFDEVRGPVIISSDVAQSLDCSNEAARQKLAKLYDQGDVDKRRAGTTVVWWFTGGEPVPPEERVDIDLED